MITTTGRGDVFITYPRRMGLEPATSVGGENGRSPVMDGSIVQLFSVFFNRPRGRSASTERDSALDYDRIVVSLVELPVRLKE